jgi:uncharacterized membrane protein
VVQAAMDMKRVASIGRLFFAGSLTAFGIQQFLYGDFVPGRAPAWPALVPGRLLWAYVSGLVFIAAGLAIVFNKGGRRAALLAGTLIFGWALLRHVPLAAADSHFGGAWTNLGKALALFGGAFAVAGSLPEEKARPQGALSALINAKDGLLYLGRLCLGAFLISSGIQHFLYVEFVMSLVPTWVGSALFWTYFAGVALIAGGAGLILPYVTRLAAALSGLMIFLWVVMLHIPRALAALDAQSRNEWTAVFEAVAMSGIAFVLAGAPSREDGRPSE